MTRSSPFKIRLKGIRQELARLRLPALLVTDRANVAYLTGFTGTVATALVTPERLLLVVDFRYHAQATAQAPHAQLVQVVGARYDDAVAEAIVELRLARLAFEADALPVSRHMGLTWRLPRLDLVPTRGVVERGREVKDAEELQAIRTAARVTSAAIAHAIAMARPGVTERELAAAVEAEMWRRGAQEPAFPTLVASGPRTALPHPSPTTRPLEPGDWLLVDAGARVDGYCADMTRTVVLGPPSERQLHAFEAVQAALAAGLATVRPGVRTADVDAAARAVLGTRGWARAFGHDTGHGVGLEIHEAPRIAADGDDTLQAGMVITVEPGVYEAGWGGVRLEQLVLVTPNGHEVLTGAPIALMAPCTSVPGRL